MTTQNPTQDPSAPAAVTDPRPLLFAAVDQLLAVVDATPADALDRPTPCAEFDVRHLLGHLVAVLGRITHVARGGHFSEVPSMVLDVPDEDVAATARERTVALRAAWSDDAVLDRMLVLPFGTVPGRAAAMAYVQETTVHAWDLATAIGRTDLLDDRFAEAAFGITRRFLPREGREQVPFGEVVDVAEDAPAYDRLVGWLGRDPRWTA